MSSLPDPHENLFVIEDKCLLTNRTTKYIKGNFLGKGGFARCYEFRKQDSKELYAVKIIQKCNLTKPRSKQKLISEIKIHESLRHANIVQFKHTFEDNQNVYILLELCTNHTLNDLLKRRKKLSEPEIQLYMLQLLDALIYLHDAKIIHRDLKLGNLFLTESMSLKLGDFGLASRIQFPGDKRKTICGTPNYIAPEILESKGHSYEVDTWSFGIIMYTLTFGRPPFESKDVKETYKKIKAVSYSFPDGNSASTPLKNLITSILQREPHKRPTLKDIKQHEFFRGSSLSRQTSILLKVQASTSNLSKVPSYKESNRQLSDNGKLYTNNDMVSSKEFPLKKDKSQDRFMNTQRNNSCFRTPIKPQKIQRVKSQRVFKQPKNKENQQAPPPEEISVKKWIDYSSKYGIGYLLNNRCYGVYFNDSTKILAQGTEHFFYIERIAKEEVSKKYSFTEYPPELNKKVGLFNHFKGYLKDEQQPKRLQAPPVPLDPRNLVYIKRWFRSKHAVIFRMSNKTVQVIFIDQTEVIINSVAKSVIYYNKNHERFDYLIHEVMQSENKELIKRFQYTKQVLNEMAKAHDQRRQDDDPYKKSKEQQQRQRSAEKILEQKDNFSNTLQTPKKGYSEFRYLRFNETASIKRE